MAHTPADDWFEGYLRREGLEGADEHEPELGVSKRPDFLVASGSSQAVCEVKQFETSAMEKRFSLPGVNLGALSHEEVFGGVREKVREAARQLKPLASRDLPLVVVLANPKHVAMAFDVEHVQGSLYGNPTFGGPYDQATGTVTTIGRIKGRDGQLTTSHPYISAIVLLRRREHADDFDQAWKAEHLAPLREQYGDTRELALAILEELDGKPPGPPGAYFYVQVLHTVTAMNGVANKLAPELFSGSRDEAYEPDAEGFYTRLR
jgi:hypothetical protein